MFIDDLEAGRRHEASLLLLDTFFSLVETPPVLEAEIRGATVDGVTRLLTELYGSQRPRNTQVAGYCFPSRGPRPCRSGGLSHGRGQGCLLSRYASRSAPLLMARTAATAAAGPMPVSGAALDSRWSRPLGGFGRRPMIGACGRIRGRSRPPSRTGRRPRRDEAARPGPVLARSRPTAEVEVRRAADVAGVAHEAFARRHLEADLVARPEGGPRPAVDEPEAAGD